ncbi:MAG TPA: c-type cytochrome biogenesis protein CcmI [Alphaproteobacteria bacterium]|jgi:cytochrome c-type biogenesis protein CcmH
MNAWTFWLVLAALAVVALLFVVAPLFLRRRTNAARADYDIAVYKDQLREVERDAARGTLDAAAAQSARLEIERRLLAAAETPENSAPVATVGRASAWRWTAVAALILLPASALIYLQQGAPGLPGVSFAEQTAETAAHKAEVDGLIAQVEARLAQNPDDVRGWVLLARAYVRLGRTADAVAAQAHATDIFDQEPDMAGDAADAAAAFGEMLVEAADGQVTPEARAAFGKAIGYDAGNARALYFLALAKMQDGDPKGAVADWKALIASAPENAPWLEDLKQRIAEVEASRAQQQQP